MNLKPAFALFAVAFCALMTYGCAGDPPAHPRSADVTERELDSVILGCRMALRARPDDAEAHVQLGQAILERVVLRRTDYHTMVWWGPASESGTLKDVGRRLDHASAVNLLDTLRVAALHIATAIALKPAVRAGLRMLLTSTSKHSKSGTGGGGFRNYS
jgi:hypothetical protein